jgi:glucosamine-6-phosphate deaminase
VRTYTYDQLRVGIYETTQEIAAAVADELAAVLRQTIATQGAAAAIFATGNSQLAFYENLDSRDDIAWDKVTIFHMDEYLGISEEHPASFRHVLQKQLVSRVKPRAFYGIIGDTADVQAELERYASLITTHKPVACIMGIGENGHLAFNDPPANFTNKRIIDVVDLVDSCRLQQVGEGHFATLDDVPGQALSLTIPALLAPQHVFVVAPETRKAAAVKAALEGPITPDCPASILRTAPHARLYLDRKSAALLDMSAG